jgi:hypothetical protein
VCASGACPARWRGPSTSPLDAMKRVGAIATFGSFVVLAFASSPDPVATRVSALVNDMVDARREESAFSSLEALGRPAVPYMVGHLSDFRPLPVADISLRNNFPGAFEESRMYSPKTVHDALAAILNQITGEHFEFVYNGDG